MPSWKQLVSKPAGAMPANLASRAGALLAGLLILVLVLSVSFFSDAGDVDAAETTAAAAAEGTVGADIQQRFDSNVQDQQRRDTSDRAAQLREDEFNMIREANLRLASEQAGDGPAFLDPDSGDFIAPEETDLRLALRLEAIEREQRSLRSPPVAQTFRPRARGAPLAPAADGRGALDTLVDADSFGQLFDRIASSAAVPSGDTTTSDPSSSGTLDVPLPHSGRLPDYANPQRLTTPQDPAGWHRIYEGSLVEAVLVTQLSGDFPSPVIAQVAVPFYSADRQHVLIPRGSRFIGTAQAVRTTDQTRLAVGFHRLLFPDGRYATLRWQGLNQLGEGALKDQVDRHYLSTFLAAGGVGLLSGLSHAGANPYQDATEIALQIGTAQSLANTGTQIMDRFLNRLPTITIRAGHRMRIWFTADLLIPQPRPLRQ